MADNDKIDEKVKWGVAGVSAGVMAAGLLLPTPTTAEWEGFDIEGQGDTWLAKWAKEGKGPTIDQYQAFSNYGLTALAAGTSGYYVGQAVDGSKAGLRRLEGYVSAQVGSLGLVDLSKKLIARKRPDGSEFVSCPSGHTAESFTNAVYLSNDLIHTYGANPATVTLAAVTIGMAAAVGVGRIGGNKHYSSDVLIGGSIGTASALLNFYLFVSEPEEGMAIDKPNLNVGLLSFGVGTTAGIAGYFLYDRFASKKTKEKISVMPAELNGMPGVVVTGTWE